MTFLSLPKDSTSFYSDILRRNMNTQMLIDAIVRQTTILIAQLATSGGVRAPLSHIAGDVFSNLAEELDKQGISRKVSADMFGMTLRSYQRKVARLGESRTFRGQSLWEAIYDFLINAQLVSRGEIMRRFHNDDQEIVRGILHDLSASGLVFTIGSGSNSSYRAATERELRQIQKVEDQDNIENMLWALIYREGPITVQKIHELSKTPYEKLEKVLSKLKSSGSIEVKDTGSTQAYVSSGLVLEIDDKSGWEAAVFDHFQAMVTAISKKLLMRDSESSEDSVGGSTYTFVIWSGHPMEQEVENQLREYRIRMSGLRKRVNQYNEQHGVHKVINKVVSYSGQYSMIVENNGNAESDDQI